MTEQQPTNKCPYCGYPVETKEHAPDCPNGKNKSNSEKQEFSQEDIPAGVEALPAEKSELLRDNKFQRVKKALKRLALWGFISYSSVIALDLAYRKTNVVPDEVGKPINKMLYSLDMITEKAVPRAERPLTESERREFGSLLAESQEDLEYLYHTYGAGEYSYFIGQLEESFQRLKRIEFIEPRGKAVMAGFESLEYSPGKVTAILKESYPKQCVEGEVDSVIFRDETEESERVALDQYNLGEEWTTVGKARMKPTGLTSVDLYAQENINDFLNTYGHELGHVNDWRRGDGLTVSERIQLFTNLTKRYLEGDSLYYSHYVESINNPDLQRNNYLKVEEYWAEICSEYFSDPEYFGDSYPEDFTLVDQWVKKKDPTFDPFSQKAERTKVVGQVIHEQEQRAFEGLPEDIKIEVDRITRAEIDRCFKTWSETSVKQTSQALNDEMNSLSEKNNIRTNFIWTRITGEVFSRVDELIEVEFQKVIDGLSDAKRVQLEQYVQQLNKKFSASDEFDYQEYELMIQEGSKAFQIGSTALFERVLNNIQNNEE